MRSAAHMRVFPPVYCKPVRCALKLAPLISGRVSAPSHPLDGRETAIPPAQRTECDAAQLRSAVCQPDTHSEAAGASRASGGLRCAAPRVLSCQSKWPAVTPAGHFVKALYQFF